MELLFLFVLILLILTLPFRAILTVRIRNNYARAEIKFDGFLRAFFYNVVVDASFAPTQGLMVSWLLNNKKHIDLFPKKGHVSSKKRKQKKQRLLPYCKCIKFDEVKIASKIGIPDDAFATVMTCGIVGELFNNVIPILLKSKHFVFESSSVPVFDRGVFHLDISCIFSSSLFHIIRVKLKNNME